MDLNFENLHCGKTLSISEDQCPKAKKWEKKKKKKENICEKKKSVLQRMAPSPTRLPNKKGSLGGPGQRWRLPVGIRPPRSFACYLLPLGSPPGEAPSPASHPALTAVMHTHWET